MMLPAQGPTTTLTEDMDVLFGSPMTEGKSDPSSKVQQTKEPDAKGGDYAGPPGDKKPGDPGGDVDLQGDAAAGHYTYVPVRGDENVGPTGKYGSGRGGAKNESEDGEGETFAEHAPVNGKMVPGFMIPPTPTAEEVAEQNEALAEEAEKAQLKRAWDVINTYFGEDEDGLNEEGLRGVINAMGYALNVAVEDIALLQTENGRLAESVNDLNKLLKESELHEGKSMPPWMKDKKKDDYEDEDEDEAKDKKDDYEESTGRGANLLESASLASILDEVAAIGGSPKQQAVNAQSKLIEGFENVVESASDLVDRIVTVIRQDEGLAEDEEVTLDEGDPRAEVAGFFYSIAEDAHNYLARLADGDVAFRVAEEDLNRLLGDIEKGVEAMHHIP